MKKSKTTIHDIAKALKIDSSTVSRALNDSPRVTNRTKSKVLAKADEIGYQRNLLASNLRKNITHTIGVIVPRISRYFFSSAIEGIEEAAYQMGYNVIICQSLEQLVREKQIVETLVANRVEGVIMSISMETLDYNHLQILIKNNIPLVFFDRHCEISGYSNIVIDDFKCGFEATQHLIDKGCKNIVHFSGPQELKIYKNRFEGYKSALIKNKLIFRKEYVLNSKLMEQDGFEYAKEILNGNLVVDGIFSSNDVAAIGAIKYLKQQNVVIPKDIAIVGFSNEPISRVIEPSLTTIDQSGFMMGKIAVELILKHIKDNNIAQKAQTIILSSNLIERNSSNK